MVLLPKIIRFLFYDEAVVMRSVGNAMVSETGRIHYTSSECFFQQFPGEVVVEKAVDKEGHADEPLGKDKKPAGGPKPPRRLVGPLIRCTWSPTRPENTQPVRRRQRRLICYRRY